MDTNQASTDLINPPEEVRETRNGDWQPLSATDPVVENLRARTSSPHEPNAPWEVARLSGAAYVYRDTTTPWSIVAKFYTVKMGEKAERYARREFRLTQ